MTTVFNNTVTTSISDNYVLTTLMHRVTEVKRKVKPIGETTIIEITHHSPFLIEGYVDVSGLDTNDSVIIREYIADKIYLIRRIDGGIDEPMLRLHSKIIPSNTSYKVTVEWVAGTPKEIDVAFIILAFS